VALLQTGFAPNLPGGTIMVGDVVSGSEPPFGNTIIPGIPDDLVQAGVDLLSGEVQRRVRSFGEDPKKPAPSPFPKLKPPTLSGFTAFEGDGAPCPGLFSVRGPDGVCINLGDLAPGGDPAITGQQPTNGGPGGFGAAVHGRFGVGMMPRVEVQAVRRCPAGMALGKDGVCYDGLGRNSPKREWPMGMKPLLTPGERNAIRIASKAAGKLARSKKSLRKASKALEKAC